MLVFRDPVSTAARARLQAALRGGLAGGALTYLPGLAAPGLALGALFGEMKAGGVGAAIAMDPALRPTTDDWPFFYHREPALAGSVAGAVLTRVLVVVGVAGALLILAPLAWLSGTTGAQAGGEARPRRRGRGRLAVLGYFGGIGLGFMLAEIALVQKLALLLGHPVYSLTVTLFVLLLATGVGSLAAGWLAERRAPGLSLAPVAAALAVAALAAGLPWVLRHAVVPSAAARVAGAAALLAPLGLVLGTVFPLGIRRLAGGDPSLVPWAWAINSVASVLGAALAVGVALVGGFSLVMLAGAAAYVVAFLCLFGLPEAPAAGA
jgi:hypothetical protein